MEGSANIRRPAEKALDQPLAQQQERKRDRRGHELDAVIRAADLAQAALTLHGVQWSHCFDGKQQKRQGNNHGA